MDDQAHPAAAAAQCPPSLCARFGRCQIGYRSVLLRPNFLTGYDEANVKMWASAQPEVHAEDCRYGLGAKA